MKESRKYVTFTARRQNVQIEGFVYVDEIDDDECIQFYNHLGFENGYRVPTNLYNDETEIEDWTDYEKLKEALFTDNLFLQLLWDFKDENKIIEREGYTLIINDDI